MMTLCKRQYERKKIQLPLLKEPLNKLPLARRRLCGMGCAKGDDANDATA
jgi:hypothetical protein